ncbi:MAG: DUF559 domain-containing protein [Candidatus Berkelbacteria bacterium]|nr:DUF559 domain-containing protein [Candidatus Berkelbacteria bacterium]
MECSWSSTNEKTTFANIKKSNVPSEERVEELQTILFFSFLDRAMSKNIKNHTEIVLVGVLKCARDLEILLTKKWYRIPARHMPKRQFQFLAFYQPATFGKNGKQIEYYAEVKNIKTKKRINLLPKEKDHPRAFDEYQKIKISSIFKLSRPIKNKIPRRVTFGFTTLNRLLKSRDILEVFNVAPIEQIFERDLKQAKIKVISQYYVLIDKKKRFRLDFAIFCENGKIAIECDNKKAHSGKLKKEKDKTKNKLLGKLGWTVLRFSENKILHDSQKCVQKVKNTILSLNN